MSGEAPKVSGGDQRVRADLAVTEVPVVLGEPTTVEVEVTNIDEVIRAYRVDVLGLDATWVSVETATVDLFPGERRRVLVSLLLPETYPSGRRRIAIEVSDLAEDAGAPVTLDLDLVLDPQDELALLVEPVSLETGRAGTFVLTPINVGNTTVDVGFTAYEPTRETTTSFEPTALRLVPGERGLVSATVQGRRPWFGMPELRSVEFAVAGGDGRAVANAVLLQRPWFSRRVVTLAGLVVAVTMFAFVIMLAFGNVADLAAANEALLKQGLGEDQPVGARAAPASITGVVSSTTGGGIDGVSVELYEADDPLLPSAATVTDASGSYRFGSLSAGDYLLRFEVAGFGHTWYPRGDELTDALPLTLTEGFAAEGVDVQLAGQPGSVEGLVTGVEVDGATVSIQLPAEAIEGSDLEPTPSVLASMQVDDTGAFLLEDLATPATYQLVVEKAGFATSMSTVSLTPGEARSDLAILLRRGDGRLAGLVLDGDGEALPGAVIEATDGETEVRTRTLSGESAGTFELRDLPTPGTYTLTISAEGFFDETVTIGLEEQEQRDDLEVALLAAEGSLAGRVATPEGEPLGGVSINVVGAGVERVTDSLSEGEVGAWTVTALPVPGTYTVSFRAAGRVTQTLSVELGLGPQADRSGIDATLNRSSAAIDGEVRDDQGRPVGGVEVVLDGAEVERRTRTADQPAGRYGFDDLPPGAYTLTFRRPGSSPQTLLVDLQAGERREVRPIDLEAQARVVGVFRRAGVPEAGAQVVAYTQAGFPNEVVASTVTRAGGVFELVGLDAPETYIIEFQVPPGTPLAGSETVFLRPGQTVELEVDRAP